MELFHAECEEILPQLEDSSIDLILTDLPYGTTKCKWDVVIPFGWMWQQLKRIRKKHSGIVLFCTQPFTSFLITSNIKWFKYCWTWDKKTGKGHLVAKYRPLQQTEDIAVFGKGRINYYPIKTPREKPKFSREHLRTEIMGGETKPGHEHTTLTRYPKTLLHYPWSPGKTYHPTEKPVPLLEYLIKTYTLEQQTVLDFTMGSGSTGVACINTQRGFIGIEKNKQYYDIALERIAKAQEVR